MNIKKLLAGASAGAIMLGAMAIPALAVKPNGPSAVNGLAHPGQVSQLYLYEKDQTSWEPIEGGAWGKLAFSEDSFVFNGHGLQPDTDYTLIRYTDPWPGTPVACLASGISNDDGNINLSGDMQAGGPKVWLVLSSDVDCGSSSMVGWNGADYLFEYNAI